MRKEWFVVALIAALGSTSLGTGCRQTVLFPIDEANVDGDDAGAAPSNPGVGTSVDPTLPACGVQTKACADGAACKTAADCTSGVCTNGTCAAPSSSDGVKNGGDGAGPRLQLPRRDRGAPPWVDFAGGYV